MEHSVQLFGYLVLTFLGFVLPLMAILVSIFQEGISKLSTQYENEKSQAEQNIRNELKKLAEAETTKVEVVEKSLQELKTIKKYAERKLSYLDPNKQLLRLFIPLMISFLGIIAFNLSETIGQFRLAFPAISLLSFGYTTAVLYKLLRVITEVRKTIDADQLQGTAKTIELLSSVAEKMEKGSQYFLKNVHLVVENVKLKNASKSIPIVANNKQDLKVEISNDEKRMAKNVQIGFIFPSDFIIEKTNYYSIYTDREAQIVRYHLSVIHGYTAVHMQPLIATALKKGEFNISTFISAENIEHTFHNLSLKVD